MQTSVEIEIANGVYPCAIGLQGVREIEKATGDGIGAVVSRIMFGAEVDWSLMATQNLRSEPTRYATDPRQAAYKIDDLIEIVRQSLIGAAELGMKPTIDGIQAQHCCTPSRANEVIKNYLLPPVSDLDTLRTLATFIAGNLALGYVPPEKKSQSETEQKKRRPRRKTDTSQQ